MIGAIDFDGTVVQQDHSYDDLGSPLILLPGAKDGLRSLKRAGHVLLLWSARANRALLYDPDLDPLVRAGVRKVHRAAWEKAQPLHWRRYEQMVEFVRENLPGYFDAVDDGLAGKPVVDFFVDDRAIQFRSGGWPAIARTYGEQAREAVKRATGTAGAFLV